MHLDVYQPARVLADCGMSEISYVFSPIACTSRFNVVWSHTAEKRAMKHRHPDLERWRREPWPVHVEVTSMVDPHERTDLFVRVITSVVGCERDVFGGLATIAFISRERRAQPISRIRETPDARTTFSSKTASSLRTPLTSWDGSSDSVRLATLVSGV